MPREKHFVDHEPTFWEKVQAFFGGYDVENMNAADEDFEHLPDDIMRIDKDTVDALNRIAASEDGDEERLDKSSLEVSSGDLNVEPDDGILDPMMQDIKLPKEKAAPEEAKKAVTAPVKKVGFFEGLWNGITGWFKGFFSSAPKKEPAQAIVKEEAPKVEEAEETDEEYAKKDPYGARVRGENKIIREKLDKLTNPDKDFVEQINDILKKGPDDVRTFLSTISDSSLQRSNNEMKEGIAQAKAEGRNSDTIVLGMVKTSMEINANAQHQLDAMGTNVPVDEDEYDFDGISI